MTMRLSAVAAAAFVAMGIAQPAFAAKKLAFTFTSHTYLDPAEPLDAYDGEGVFTLDAGTPEGADTFYSITAASGTVTSPGSTYATTVDDVFFGGVRLSGGVYTLENLAIFFNGRPDFYFLSSAGTPNSLTGFATEVSVDADFTLREVASSAVPEPASWALMIAGFGMVGAGMRRRRVRVAFA